PHKIQSQARVSFTYFSSRSLYPITLTLSRYKKKAAPCLLFKYLPAERIANTSCIPRRIFAKPFCAARAHLSIARHFLPRQYYNLIFVNRKITCRIHMSTSELINKIDKIRVGTIAGEIKFHITKGTLNIAQILTANDKT